MKTFLAFVSGGLPSFLYVALVGILLLISNRGREKRDLYPIGVAYLAASLALLLINRFPIFFYDRVINPDEALMAANALKAHYGWLNWDIVDPLTSGPLNSSILAWPRIFGADITFFSVRFTGALLLFGASALVFMAALEISGLTSAIVACFPLFFFAASTSHFDFVHYTSELLSVFLISIGIFAYIWTGKHRSLLLLGIAGFALGCVPYAKLQASPVAALVGLFVLSRCYPFSNTNRLNLLIVLGCAFAPTAMFLGPLAVGGGLEDFYKSYVSQQSYRVVVWHDYLPLMVWRTPSFFALLLATISSLIALFVILSRTGLRFPVEAKYRALFALTAASIPISYFCVVASGRPYSHYLLVLIPAIALAQLCFAVTAQNSFESSRVSLVICFLLLACLMLPTAIAEQRRNFTVASNGAFLNGSPLHVARPLQWLRPNDSDKILCWGWQAECYVDNALQGATREATNENQLYETPLKQYFRQRFMTELSKSKPAFIFDAVAPGSFGFTDVARQSIQSFPELRSFVEQGYERITTSGNECPRIYVERQRLTEIRNSLVGYSIESSSESSADASLYKIDDGNVTETCNDFWTPSTQTGWFKVRLKAPSIRTIALLNTRGGRGGDRGTRRALIKFQVGDKTSAEQVLDLNPFPWWTIVRFPGNITADTFTFEILSWRGNGGGLNELKFYSD